MRLDTFQIADAVSAPPDGKFYIHGGGLTRLIVPTLPFPVPQLGLFVRLQVSQGDLGKVHDFEFTLTDPDGEPVGDLPKFRAPVDSPQKLEPGEQQFVQLAINVGGVVVARRGLHRFLFAMDGEQLAERPIPVVRLSREELEALAAAAPPTQGAPNRAARRHPPPRR